MSSHEINSTCCLMNCSFYYDTLSAGLANSNSLGFGGRLLSITMLEYGFWPNAIQPMDTDATNSQGATFTCAIIHCGSICYEDANDETSKTVVFWLTNALTQ
jgi:hypothetical protein